MTLETDALLLSRSLELSLGRRRLADPVPGEVLVGVAWAGVCGSDLHVLRNGAWVSYWPATLGHEVAGTVLACPGGEIAPGALVVADSRVPCGACAGCRRADNLCSDLAWLGESAPGGFARHLLISAERVVPAPAGLEPAIAALGEPLAVAMHACARALDRWCSGAWPEEALVLGYGPIGALVHAVLEQRCPGIAVTVSDPVPSRRLLAEACGATVLDRSPEPAAYGLVVDAAGAAGSLASAIEAAARGATVALVALGHDPLEVVPADLAEHSLAVVGCSGFDDELPGALELLAAEPERFRPLVSDAILLEEAPQRLAELLLAPAPGKVLVRP